MVASVESESGREGVSLVAVEQARLRIRGHVSRTALVRSSLLSRELGTNVYLKLENLQKTGSFKPRGAFNKLLSLTEAERKRGVVAVSGGNHAQAVAYAARTLGLSAIIAMPESTPANYLDATRGYGAEIALCPNIHAAFATAHRLAAEGRVLVHPFDDPAVMAGQGTLGLELLDDCPEMTHVFISIGGGGLIAGMAAAIRTIKPDVTVFGVETVGADAMAQAVAAGKVVEIPKITSIARTLGAPAVSQATLEAVQKHVAEVVVVPDREAVVALVDLLERAKLLVEPAAACAVAAARARRDRFGPDDHVVILLCGGNTAVTDVARWIGEFGLA